MACLLLMLAQPPAAPACGDATGTGAARGPRVIGPEVISGQEQDAKLSLQMLDGHLSATGIGRCERALPTEPFLSHLYFAPGERMALPGPPIQHRGELILDPSVFFRDISFFASGPDTPPPATGDWIVDEPGNNVNNTTILLNGSLKVTTGDLTLDNVTLIMNCTADGQYGINVSAGGVLDLVNCNITAFSGALHYKFAVFGEMTMDRCNVSEMWGESSIWWEGGGVALFSDATIIRSSTISKGETNGVQVHGSAGPVIMGSNISDNRLLGFFIGA